LNAAASPAALVDSADAGRYEELSFFCTSDNLPWYAPPAPPTSSTSTATAMTAKNGTPRGNRAGSGGRVLSGATSTSASTSANPDRLPRSTRKRRPAAPEALDEGPTRCIAPCIHGAPAGPHPISRVHRMCRRVAAFRLQARSPRPRQESRLF